MDVNGVSVVAAQASNTGSVNRLCCAGARAQSTCSNTLMIRRGEVEARGLKTHQEKLLRHHPFHEIGDECTREMNRFRMEHRASLSAAGRELDYVQSAIRGRCCTQAHIVRRGRRA